MMVTVFIAFLIVAIYLLLHAKLPRVYKYNILHRRSTRNTDRKALLIQEIESSASQHEVVSKLWEMILDDGARSWPPTANHRHTTWPKILRSYRDIYVEMAGLLPQSGPSLDALINRARIDAFRQEYSRLLHERIDLAGVMQLLQATESGRSDLLPLDSLNAFYCCIASIRHAYRWGTIPVVLAAQVEKSIDLPPELVEPWEHLQTHFGCPSESGNLTSNILLNFDDSGKHIYKINTGLSPEILAAEEAFARIFHSVESLSLPIYRDLVFSIIAFTRNDKVACARHVTSINNQLRLVLSAYFDNLHNDVIPQSIWLSRIQGFYAWGAGREDDAKTQYETFDGLSGNQALVFQALDAWLGIEQFLSNRDMERNVPRCQREFCHALRKYSFRGQLNRETGDASVIEILSGMEDVVRKLKMFRNVHRVRAKAYLSQPVPERTHMTAGKGVLQPTLDASLEQLDVFMVRRLEQTI